MAVDLKQESLKIVDRFGKAGVQLNEKDIEDRLRLLISQFKVQPAEATRTVISFFRQQHGLSFDDMKGTRGAADVIGIGSIPVEENRWISLRAKVVQLWESRSEVVAQTGLIGDATGTTKFTIFAKSAESLPALEEGKSYSFDNVVTSVFNGQVGVKCNKNTTITELSEEIEVSRKTETMTGIITSISSGSGLIKRCPECNRKLTKGMCGEHGRVEGIFDLRIKAVFSQLGTATSIDLLMNKEVVEALTGISLDKAKEMATEALDQGVVTDVLTRNVSGRYYRVSGAMLPGSTMLVDEIESVNIADPASINGLIAAVKETAAGGV